MGEVGGQDSSWNQAKKFDEPKLSSWDRKKPGDTQPDAKGNKDLDERKYPLPDEKTVKVDPAWLRAFASEINSLHSELEGAAKRYPKAKVMAGNWTMADSRARSVETVGKFYERAVVNLDKSLAALAKGLMKSAEAYDHAEKDNVTKAERT